MLSLLWNLWEWLFQKTERKLVIVGIDNAGKSTTLEQLKLQYTGKGMDLDKIPPTIGLNIGRFQIDGIIAICWDVGGQLGLRQLWNNYFEEVDGIIFVMDSADTARFEEASKALQSVLDKPSAEGKPLLVLLNKCDITGSVGIEEISSTFHFESIKGRPFKPLPCSAKANRGLDEGIRWVVSEAVKFNRLKSGDTAT